MKEKGSCYSIFCRLFTNALRTSAKETQYFVKNNSFELQVFNICFPGKVHIILKTFKKIFQLYLICFYSLFWINLSSRHSFCFMSNLENCKLEFAKIKLLVHIDNFISIKWKLNLIFIYDNKYGFFHLKEMSYATLNISNFKPLYFRTLTCKILFLNRISRQFYAQGNVKAEIRVT